MQLTYNQQQAAGMPGMKADASLDVVDSFVIEGSGVNPGYAVIRGTKPLEQVKITAIAGDGAKVRGITMHTHKEEYSDTFYYGSKETVGVMTFGRIWAQVDADIAEADIDTVAKVVLASGKLTNAAVAAGIEATVGITFAGPSVTGPNGLKIAPVQIRK